MNDSNLNLVDQFTEISSIVTKQRTDDSKVNSFVKYHYESPVYYNQQLSPEKKPFTSDDRANGTTTDNDVKVTTSILLVLLILIGKKNRCVPLYKDRQ